MNRIESKKGLRALDNLAGENPALLKTLRPPSVTWRGGTADVTS